MTMRRMMAAGLLAMTLAAPAMAMNVEEFLARGLALSKQMQAGKTGAAAQKEAALLKTEIVTASDAWVEQQKPATGAPNACPPAGRFAVPAADLEVVLRAVPAAERKTTSVTDAVVTGLNRRFPCPGDAPAKPAAGR